MQSLLESRDGRTPDLDALRIVAAAAVVTLHCTEYALTVASRALYRHIETPFRHFLYAMFDRRTEAGLAARAAAAQGSGSR